MTTARKTPARKTRKAASAARTRKTSAKAAPAAMPNLVIRGAEQKGPRISASLKALAGATVKHPGKLAGGLRRAGAELLKVARGRSTVAPAGNDRRFDDPTWRDNAVYRR